VTQTITLFVASGDKHTTDRALSLSRGSHIAVVGSGSIGDRSMQSIAAIRPQVCLLSGREAEADYLSLARRLFTEVPDTKVVLFGPSDDPSVMARAAASRVWNYLPEYITYPEFIRLVTEADAGKQPDNMGIFATMVAALPPSHTPPLSSHTRGLESVVRQCLALGLHADDIAWYLSTDIELIRSHVRTILRRTASPSPTWRRLGYVVLAAAALVTAFKAVTATWSLGSRRIAISGHVQYGAQPLDSGVIEFRSLDSETVVVTGALIQDGLYRIPGPKGLLPGDYAVMISSPEATGAESVSALSGVAPPAKERIPEHYNSSSTQRVEVRRLGQNVFDFTIPPTSQESHELDPMQQE